jgi:serine phosphatase RsbU (regulator of sigma subunit)
MHAEQPPDVIRDRILAEVTSFADGQPQHDDITMVIVKIQGEGLRAKG